MDEILCKYFQKIGERFCSKTSEIVKAILKYGKANTHDIAREMCVLNSKKFKRNNVFFIDFYRISN